MSEDSGGLANGRRAFLAGLGAAGLAGLAGCTGDGGGDGGGTDGQPAFELFAGQPTPQQAQYNSFNIRSYPAFGPMMRHSLALQSAIDNQPYPDIASEWSYADGTLDVQLNEDFYWWDGTQFTSEDVTLSAKLRQYSLAGETRSHVERVEATGDFSLRYHLNETLRETPAVVRTIVDVRPVPRSYYREWLQKFEDASSKSARDDIAIRLANLREDEVLEPMYNGPFAIEEVDDISWTFLRRTDVDPTPHYVDQINFDTVVVNSTSNVNRERMQFTNAEAPFTDLPTMMDADLTFPSTVVDLPEANSPGAYIFNCASGPTGSVHFRRAFAYVLDRKRHSPEGVRPDRVTTPFTSAPAEEAYFGDLLDSFETYGYDEVRTDAARAEMEAGGFERNSAGKWLYRSGPKAGQPISITVPVYSSMEPFASIGGNFKQKLRDFGIDITFDLKTDPQAVLDRLASGNFQLSMSFWGGPSPLPADVYRATFVRETPTYGNPSFPSTWEGPPVGEPDADPATSYAVGEMATGLDAVLDDQRYETAVDRLGWVFNQALPKLPIGSFRQRYRLNQKNWGWNLPTEEHPDSWFRAGLQERSWNVGVVEATGAQGTSGGTAGGETTSGGS
ncbi:MAG: ABC transporter substrate-binding protein [Halobacteriaceae archaeon]